MNIWIVGIILLSCIVILSSYCCYIYFRIRRIEMKVVENIDQEQLNKELYLISKLIVILTKIHRLIMPATCTIIFLTIIIKAFIELADAKADSSPDITIVGIISALIYTAIGLSINIPLVIVQNIFIRKLEKIFPGSELVAKIRTESTKWFNTKGKEPPTKQ